MISDWNNFSSRFILFFFYHPRLYDSHSFRYFGIASFLLQVIFHWIELAIVLSSSHLRDSHSTDVTPRIKMVEIVVLSFYVFLVDPLA